MNSDTQRRFMYLFERIGEPLYLGPRGTSNVQYNVPTEGFSATKRHAQQMIRQGFSQVSSVSVDVASPTTTPNFSNISRLCPKSSVFSYFIPNHREAARELRALLTNQQDLNSFLAMACTCRDSDFVNCQLWMYAFSGACLARRDMRGFRMPALIEVIPDSFINPHAIRQAQQMASLPAADRAVIMIDQNFTGQDTNPENRLSYYREDYGINSHHWHWHIIYPLTAPRTGPGSRNRKGELFYYMHHSMMARYEAERLCNGMERTRVLDIFRSIDEGYFPKLTVANSGMIWGSRQERTTCSSVERPVENLRVTMDDLRKWSDRVLEAIDTGVIIGTDGSRIQLTEQNGIDVLGDIIENGGAMITPNERFYGDLHNMGHVVLAFSHDPTHRHRENMGVMGDPTTAMRDPVFYRWHKYVDEIFDKYKVALQPYTEQQLVWQGIQITEFSVQTGKLSVNNLVTFFMQTDIDLARGLDFNRNAMTLGPVFARLTHLNHEPFTYRINVTNTGRQAVVGTVRIFMAPRNNEQGRRFAFREQRLLFFELDKFETTLQPGQNQISRNSTDSSVTIPANQTFRDLESLPQDPNAVTGQQAICGCGWPQHMLIPRGAPVSGVIFDLFVMITNSAEDRVRRTNPNQTEAQRQGCRDSVSYCGVLDELYPDAKPMGFPFDRNRVIPNTNNPIPDLDAFIPANSNMRYTQVRIVHRTDPPVVSPNGAPTTMGVVNKDGMPMQSNMRGTGSGGGGQTVRPSGNSRQIPGGNGNSNNNNRRQPDRPTSSGSSRSPSRSPSPPGWVNFGGGGWNSPPRGYSPNRYHNFGG